jgi:hypothetical protein
VAKEQTAVKTDTTSAPEQPSVKETAVEDKEPSKPNEQTDDWFISGAVWGASWVQSAKQKTLSTLELVKKDLNEFSDTVQTEASALANATAQSVKQQAQLFQQFVTTPDGTDEAHTEEGQEKKEPLPSTEPAKDDEEKTTPPSASSGKGFNFGWMKNIVDTVQKFTIEDTTQDEEECTEKICLPRKSLLDQCQLLQLQNDERTFLAAPSQSVDLYRDWLEDFRISEYNGEINVLLGYNPRLREIYAKLVPAQVDNHTFWNRYFFKVHVAELDKEVQQKQEKDKMFSELHVNTENAARSVEGSPAGTEKDDAWSIVSNNTSNEDQAEENNDNSEVRDKGALTPRAKEEAEDWENFEETTA